MILNSIFGQKFQNQFTLYKIRSYCVAIPTKNAEKQKFKFSDLDLRIARIDPSRQVSMDEPSLSENELT